MNRAGDSSWQGRRLRVRGHVQGVGFRWSMMELANRLGVTGWVRNVRDGSVEALVCGENPELAAMIHWAGQGPAGARIDSLEVEEVVEGLAEPHEGFSQAPTI